MENIIYAAGNPDAFPIEYYSPQTGRFEGLIPSLLRDFSTRGGYSVRYLEEVPADRRAELIKNRQVDLASRYRSDRRFENVAYPEIILLETPQDRVSFALGDHAPREFISDFRAFITEKQQETFNGQLLSEARQARLSAQGLPVSLVLPFVLLLLAAIAALALLAKKRRVKAETAEKKLETDHMTGVGNRAYLERRYESMLSRSTRELYSLIWFELDEDRLVEDLGREIADRYICFEANQLSETVDKSGALARFLPASFVVLLESMNESLTEEFLKPVMQRLYGRCPDLPPQYRVRVSAGVYSLGQESGSLDESLFNAHQTARSALTLNQPYAFFSPQIYRAVQDENRMRLDLQSALENEQFQLYFQFYVDGQSLAIRGGEALVRWQHPKLGYLPPSRFIPLLEQEGLISSLDHYMLDKACRLLESVHRQGKTHFFVSCNFSRKTFGMIDFVERAIKTIDQYEFDRQCLVLEITESAQMKMPALIRDNLLAMQKYGVRVELDDFGSGFTSLFDLSEFPVNGLKIDKSLIDRITSRPGRIVLSNVIKAAHDLGLTVIAEGIEEKEQISLLQDLQCDLFQGFYFFKPIPEWEIERYL